MPEIWKNVPGFENYTASSYGRICSNKGKILNGSPRGGKVKYLSVTLRISGKPYWRFIHQLILETFVGPRPKGMWGLHRDGKSFRNVLDNLYWGTPKENTEDRRKHGRSPFGEKNVRAKLTTLEVLEIRSRYKPGAVRQVDLAKEFGVSQHQISRVTRNEAWKQL